jgi:hypothetical protein
MSASYNLLYRIHVFNFLFSLFTLATGYVELTRTLIKSQGFSALNIMQLVSLLLAHLVVLMYLCWPKRIMSEDMLNMRDFGD